MRKETQNIVRAFVAGNSAREQRTETNGRSIKLLGSKIAWRDDSGQIFATLAGYPTKTTRDRLNGLCQELGCEFGFSQKNKVQYFNGQPISSKDVVRLK